MGQGASATRSEMNRGKDYRYYSSYEENQQINRYIGRDGRECQAGEYPHIHIIFQPKGRVDLVAKKVAGQTAKKLQVGEGSGGSNGSEVDAAVSEMLKVIQ